MRMRWRHASQRVGISDRSGDRNGSAGGDWPPPASTTAAGGLVLVVDPCVVGDGRVVQVAAWVKKGDETWTRLLVRSEVVDRGGSGDLGSAVG